MPDRPFLIRLSLRPQTSLPAEMLRIIREEEAPALSRKLTAMGAAAAGVAAQRQTDPTSLRHIVDGDLNQIAMKALEKARDRRYASVAEFAADIQRHIERRPVLASPPSGLSGRASFSAETGWPLSVRPWESGSSM